METILLVEDNEDDIFLMRRAFKATPITNTLAVVTDGQQAVDYLAGNGEYANREKFPLPCLILLDMKLPYLNGLEVIKWVRQQPSLQTLLIVMLTASSIEKDVDSAYRAGVNGFLVKPPTAEKLTEMLRALKNFWLEFNQTPPPPFPVSHSETGGQF